MEKTLSARIRKAAASQWARPAVAGLLIIPGRLVPVPAVQAAFLVAAAVVAGWPNAVRAFRLLRFRTVGIDLLVTIAAVGAIVIGEFWEAAAVTFLFSVGHALESATLAKTRAALSDLVDAAPQMATVVRDGARQVIAARDVHLGETVIVAQGERVPVDGTVSSGSGVLDESAITGEALPAERTPGDEVHAGTTLHVGSLQVRADRVGADTAISRITARVEDVQDSKSQVQTFLERFSAWYTPAIMVAAPIVGLATHSVELALTLLVVSCPGALVISIPVAMVAGVGAGARRGILVRSGAALEAAARIDTVAFDKTGTLTEPIPQLVAIRVPASVSSIDEGGAGGAVEREVLRAAALAEAASGHPLARPILLAAEKAGLSVADAPAEVETIPGRGVAAVVEDRRVLVGSPALLADNGVAVPDDVAGMVAEEGANGHSVVLVSDDGCYAGALLLANVPRPGAAEAVAGLRRAGVRRVVMLTGDAQAVAEGVAAEVGVDDVRAGLLPEDKLAAIEELQAAGARVAMVGDGINDAPALARADIGIAMGGVGSALAVDTADVALIRDELGSVPEALSLARRTSRVVRQNVALAIATVAVLLAGVLFGGVTMAVGMLVHEASVLVVIVNALRLLRSGHGNNGNRVVPQPTM